MSSWAKQAIEQNVNKVGEPTNEEQEQTEGDELYQIEQKSGYGIRKSSEMSDSEESPVTKKLQKCKYVFLKVQYSFVFK